MTTITVRRTINAPEGHVFKTVAEVQHLSQVIPDVTRVEFLTDQHSGVGTRFRETRRSGKRENVTELEITEYDAPRKVRMVAESHGTVWDTVFTVESANGGAVLTITMDARALKLVPRIFNALFKGLMRRGLEKHIDAVKAWCER